MVILALLSACDENKRVKKSGLVHHHASFISHTTQHDGTATNKISFNQIENGRDHRYQQRLHNPYFQHEF